MKIGFLTLSAVIFLLLAACSGSPKEKKSKSNPANNEQSGEDNSNSNSKSGVEYLNTQSFIDKVFDFRNEPEWKFKGSIPVVIDFYADWCGPCKRVAPIMVELSGELKGKVQFYKVNTDMEQELANAFGIQSIPSIMFCPMQGKPTMTVGAYPKDEYVRMINELLLNNK
jgi:thioredoxin